MKKIIMKCPKNTFMVVLGLHITSLRSDVITFIPFYNLCNSMMVALFSPAIGT